VPSIILLPHGPSDVQAAIRWIAANSHPFTVMSGGHSFAGRSIATGAVLLRLSRMNHVHVNVEEATAWVGMGATVKDFDMETNAFNLCGVGGHVSNTGKRGREIQADGSLRPTRGAVRVSVTAGPVLTRLAAFSPQAWVASLATAALVASLGVSGAAFPLFPAFSPPPSTLALLSLVEGYGLAADNILEARVVLADGSLVQATPTVNADLFWGICGAGSHLGVVVEVKVKLFPLPEGNLLCSGQIFWLAEDDATLRKFLETFAAINANCDAKLSVCPFWANPPVEPFLGRRTVGTHTCWLGDESMAEAEQIMAKALAPLFALAEPLLNLLGPKPFHVFNSMQDNMAAENKWRCTAFRVDAFDDKFIDAVMAMEPHRPPATAQMLGTRALRGCFWP
jgi:hypothetical protein